MAQKMKGLAGCRRSKLEKLELQVRARGWQERCISSASLIRPFEFAKCSSCSLGKLWTSIPLVP
jgi:hypothetical protein